jgi:hypothetical protein
MWAVGKGVLVKGVVYTGRVIGGAGLSLCYSEEGMVGPGRLSTCACAQPAAYPKAVALVQLAPPLTCAQPAACGAP